MREERKDVKHQYDIWHFTENIKKALLKAAKKKNCDIINRWIKGIINHFWCCSRCGGNYQQLQENWMSIMFHIRNKHKWVGYNHYKKCKHPMLTKSQIKKKKWIKEGTPAFCEIEKVIKKKKTLNDLKLCTEFRHSGNVEVYHSVYLKYCPKRLRVSLEAMIARTELAVLHFNSVITLPFAKTKLGKQKYKLQHSRITNNWVIKKIKERGNKAYLQALFKELVWLRVSNEYVPLPKLPIIPKNIAPVEKPDKEECIKNMNTLFT